MSVAKLPFNFLGSLALLWFSKVLCVFKSGIILSYTLKNKVESNNQLTNQTNNQINIQSTEHRKQSAKHKHSTTYPEPLANELTIMNQNNLNRKYRPSERGCRYYRENIGDR